MSISLKSEQLLTFQEAAQLLPEGRRPRASTWWRWWKVGRNGVRLETLVVGGRRYTTAESVARFALALTQRQPIRKPDRAA